MGMSFTKFSQLSTSSVKHCSSRYIFKIAHKWDLINVTRRITIVCSIEDVLFIMRKLTKTGMSSKMAHNWHLVSRYCLFMYVQVQFAKIVFSLNVDTCVNSGKTISKYYFKWIFKIMNDIVKYSRCIIETSLKAL